MVSLGTPVDKADAVKPDKSVRCGQPKIAVLSLHNRIDEGGWDAIFVTPDRMSVLGEGLVKSDASACSASRTQHPTAQRERIRLVARRDRMSHACPILPLNY